MPKLSAAIVALFTAILALMVTVNSAHASVISPTRYACAAFQTWNHHKSHAHAKLMLSASKHANSTIQTDIIVVWTEYVQRDTWDLPFDTRATLRDCSHAR